MSTEEQKTELAYRRIHRLTPLLRLWAFTVGMLAIILINLDRDAFNWIAGKMQGDQGPLPMVLVIVGFVVVFFLVVFLVSQIWWAATGFRLDGEGVQLKRGVISTQLRSARYDRIQAVDVVEPFVPRLFGLATVRIETAGGNQSSLNIEFLPRAEAEELRAELLESVRSEPADAQLVERHDEPGVEEDTDYVVEPIPTWRSLVAAMLRGTTIFGAVWTVLSVVGPWGAGLAVPVLAAVVAPIWNMINRSWRFNARLDDDEVLHLSFGLASRRRQAVPLSRIHAVSVIQPVLWRPLGWWSVSISVAGYGAESSQGGTSRILPVGSKAQALALAAVVSKQDRVDVEAFADPEGAASPNYTSPQRARWISPLDAHRQATTLHESFVIVHSGLITRRVAMIDASHIQELSLKRGPLNNLFGLSTVRMDLVPGPVRMAGRDMEQEDAVELLDLLRQRKLPEFTASGLNYT